MAPKLYQLCREGKLEEVKAALKRGSNVNSRGSLYTVCDDTQNLNETESETFFRYQILPIPNPILFPIPNIFNTESDTFFDTKIFRYRIRNHLKNGKVSKPRSFETETSHSGSEFTDSLTGFNKSKD